ncbi:hypothetical protein LB505_004052 [Fusarium chuoi]|nr:hypothetical protein LB505_004052 [Fusarium chuoi]
MKKRLKNYGFEEIRVDKSGYFIVFRNSFTGKSEAERCFRAVNHTEFFNYDMTMQLCLPRPHRDGPSMQVQSEKQIPSHDIATRRKGGEEKRKLILKRRRSKELRTLIR